MDLLSSCPYWPIKDGLPASYPPLENDVRCEVAIIGAGITGALMAWHLVDAGFSVVVLDRRDVAQGSTAGSTSLLQYELDVPLRRLGRLIGVGPAHQAYHDSLRAVLDLGRLVRRLKIACEFAPKASLLVASADSDVAGLRREFAARRSAGFNVTWWDRRAVAARSSLPHPAAILSAAPEAAQLDVFALTHGLLAAAARHGARVHDRTHVTRRRRRARSIELVTNRGAVVHARWVVIATGYEADQFLPEPVTHLTSTYALISEPCATLDGWPAGEPLIWDTARPYLYLRTTPDRRVIVGGGDDVFRDPGRRDRALSAKVVALRRRFHRLFPRIPLEVGYAWAGTFGSTRDGLPFIGEHARVPRTWFALGYGGNGITFSLIAAQLFRDKLLGRPPRHAGLYSFDRAQGE